jgi:hypothetical protein
MMRCIWVLRMDAFIALAVTIDDAAVLEYAAVVVCVRDRYHFSK